ncbi:hypothetical protein [Lysinibacillus cavernae]|uniref:hypothetical protein n=1 Tax=Lysinibacillus cavernae TaxID=2666135 RepID=UPI0018C34264|nr:hypothetical protein [Lysinibacillus cavernae]
MGTITVTLVLGKAEKITYIGALAAIGFFDDLFRPDRGVFNFLHDTGDTKTRG